MLYTVCLYESTTDAFMAASNSLSMVLTSQLPTILYTVSIPCDIVNIVNILYSYPSVLNIVLYCSNNIRTLNVSPINKIVFICNSFKCNLFNIRTKQTVWVITSSLTG